MSAPLLDRTHNPSRRGFLRGLAGVLAAGVAPAAIGSGILMPVKTLWMPQTITAPVFTHGTYYIYTIMANDRMDMVLSTESEPTKVILPPNTKIVQVGWTDVPMATSVP